MTVSVPGYVLMEETFGSLVKTHRTYLSLTFLMCSNRTVVLIVVLISLLSIISCVYCAGTDPPKLIYNYSDRIYVGNISSVA